MAATQDAQEPRFYAGLFRRWGRGKKELTNLAESEPERRWAGVAEWLRVAHLLLDEKNADFNGSADRAGQARVVDQDIAN